MCADYINVYILVPEEKGKDPFLATTEHGVLVFNAHVGFCFYFSNSNSLLKGQ